MYLYDLLIFNVIERYSSVNNQQTKVVNRSVMALYRQSRPVDPDLFLKF